MTEATLTPWHGPNPPSRLEIEAIFRKEGLTPRWWSNGPGDHYGGHTHTFHKVLYCVDGSIRFDTLRGAFDLSPGDRLEIPPGVSHSAVVGPSGVTCLEAPKDS